MDRLPYIALGTCLGVGTYAICAIAAKFLRDYWESEKGEACSKVNSLYYAAHRDPKADAEWEAEQKSAAEQEARDLEFVKRIAEDKK
jgi:hypothetical protein